MGHNGFTRKELRNMDKDCRNCMQYQYIPKDMSSPYGEEWCSLDNTDFAGDYSPCDVYMEAQTLLAEATESQLRVIKIIESNLNIEFIGANKGDARDFIRKNINQSKQHIRHSGDLNSNEMMVGCHGVAIDKADYYSELVPNR